jgi:AcrR family transcriptional regulator
MTQTTSASLRKDAARNRQRLLDAATELFAARGLDVTLNDIARQAGVGIGTAYRRFANKDELIDALFEVQLDRYAQMASDALQDADAWHGMVQFFEQSLRMQREDRGLAELLHHARIGHDNINQMRTRITPMVDAIVDRAKQAGVVRPDIEGTDLLFLQLGLSAIMDKTRQIAPNLYLRTFRVYLDGLRVDHAEPTELDVPPLTVDQAHAMMTSTRKSAANKGDSNQD